MSAFNSVSADSLNIRVHHDISRVRTVCSSCTDNSFVAQQSKRRPESPNTMKQPSGILQKMKYLAGCEEVCQQPRLYGHSLSNQIRDAIPARAG